MLLVGSLSLALILYAVLLLQGQDLELIYSRIPGQYQTPLLNIRMKSRVARADPLDNSSRPSVLLIHGLSASKSVMIHLGTQFARWGMNSYLMDLPGHGESNGTFSWASCQGAVQEALTYLRTVSAGGRPANRPSATPPVFLVGHSMGAALAVEAARSRADVAGVIAVSPAAVQVDQTTPRGLLILLGQFDLPFVRRGGLLLFQQATGISLTESEDSQARSSPDGLKRVVILPWTEHSLGIFSPRALSEMAAWLQRAYPALHFDSQGNAGDFLLRLIVCLLLLYSLVPGFHLLHHGISLLNPKRFFDGYRSSRGASGTQSSALTPDLLSPGGAREKNLEKLSPPTSAPTKIGVAQNETRPQPQGRLLQTQGPSWRNRVPPLWLYGLAGILSLLLLLVANPWNRLRLMGAGYLCGFLGLTGGLALSWQRPRRTTWTCSWVDLATILLSVLLFVCLAGPLFSRLLVHLTMSPTRLWRYPIISLSIYPFFLFDEWVTRHWITFSSFDKLIYFHFSTRLLLALLLILGFFVLQNGQFLIVLVLPALLILSSLCWFQTWGVYNKTQSVIASAAFGALLTAWFLSTFFVQL